MRKLLTRTLTLATAALLAYFMWISTDTGKIPTEVRDESESLTRSSMSLGEGVGYKAFDTYGREMGKGIFDKVRQATDNTIQVEGIEATITTRAGKKIHVTADYFDTRSGDERVMSSKPGGTIHVREEGGITIKTAGPLIYGADEVLHTEAKADFSLANLSGTCKGLRYRSEDFLELKEDVLFTAESADQSSQQIDAAFLRLSLPDGRGLIRKGIIANRKADALTLLEAAEILLGFTGGKRQDYKMVDVEMKGKPARFQWGMGELESSYFNGCFNDTGQWIEQLTTGEDAVFNCTSQDGYWFSGRSGSLTLSAQHWQPKLLRGNAAVTIEGRRGDGPHLELVGSSGLETTFADGIASSTRIYGEPQFIYGDQQGHAGSLRVLHEEHQILFSAGAEIIDEQHALSTKGDEILLANWDQPKREVFAFRFVEIVQNIDGPDPIRSFGDTLELHLPDGDLKIGGSPARVERTSETIEGNNISFQRLDNTTFDLQAEDAVNAHMITEDGTFWVEARRLDFKGRRRTLAFETVRRAVIPDRGELSGGKLLAFLKKDGDKMILDRVEMKHDVVFKGSRLVDGELKPIFCQADEMDYVAAEEVIYFRGIDRDVIFSDPRVETRNRGLIYNLKDGSLSGYSERHRTSTTTVPLEKSPLKNN